MNQPLVHNAGPAATLVVRGAHVLDPRTGVDAPMDVVVSAGEITEIAQPGLAVAPDGAEEIDGAGKHLFPAFVDPHVHLRTPGQEHKEDLDTGTRSGAAGGYCALVCMPNTSPVLDSAPLLRSLREESARHARIPVGVMPAITRNMEGGELTDMAELRQEGAVGFTDDGRPVVSAGMLRKALRYQKLCGGVIALHEEDPTLSAGGSMREGAVSALLGVGGIPSISESTMVERDCSIAGYEGARVHMQHLSSIDSVRAIRDAKARGVQVTCEASPHHLCLTDESILGRPLEAAVPHQTSRPDAGSGSSLDTSKKMNPPLGTEEDRQALIAGLLDGTVDCIATDHAPHARDEKEVPFEQAPMGTTGLETAFAAVYTDLVLPGVLPLALVIEKLTSGLALLDLFTPKVEVGAPANLTLIDLGQEWTVGEHGYHSRSANNCFAGRRLKGRVLLTVAAGAVVHRTTEGNL